MTDATVFDIAQLCLIWGQAVIVASRLAPRRSGTGLVQTLGWIVVAVGSLSASVYLWRVLL